MVLAVVAISAGSSSDNCIVFSVGRHLATLKRQKQAVARNSRIRVSSSAKREYFRELKSEQSQYDNVERGVVLFIVC